MLGGSVDTGLAPPEVAQGPDGPAAREEPACDRVLGGLAGLDARCIVVFVVLSSAPISISAILTPTRSSIP